MRADRLLAMLILLQTRGRMTARELSEELEVSERTVYRDMLALGMAGMPVYTERGPGGGCTLLESYRTDLNGLTENEVRALFMLSIPAPLVDLGLSLELKAALLKLSAALPASFFLNTLKERASVRHCNATDVRLDTTMMDVPPHRAQRVGLRNTPLMVISLAYIV